jgi:hypothetical protein
MATAKRTLPFGFLRAAKWFIIPTSNPGTPIIQQSDTNGDIPTQKPIGQ